MDRAWNQNRRAIMKADDFQKEAGLTDVDYSIVIARLQVISTVRLLHAAMGMCTETGEFMDMLKKHILYGRTIDNVNLEEELGDLQWYVALAIDELQTSFGFIFETNIKKLRARYPDRFSEFNANNRDLEAERKILEEGSQR